MDPRLSLAWQLGLVRSPPAFLCCACAGEIVHGIEADSSARALFPAPSAPRDRRTRSGAPFALVGISPPSAATKRRARRRRSAPSFVSIPIVILVFSLDPIRMRYTRRPLPTLSTPEGKRKRATGLNSTLSCATWLLMLWVRGGGEHPSCRILSLLGPPLQSGKGIIMQLLQHALKAGRRLTSVPAQLLVCRRTRLG